MNRAKKISSIRFHQHLRYIRTNQKKPFMRFSDANCVSVASLSIQFLNLTLSSQKNRLNFSSISELSGEPNYRDVIHLRICSVDPTRFPSYQNCKSQCRNGSVSYFSIKMSSLCDENEDQRRVSVTLLIIGMQK